MILGIFLRKVPIKTVVKKYGRIHEYLIINFYFWLGFNELIIYMNVLAGLMLYIRIGNSIKFSRDIKNKS